MDALYDSDYDQYASLVIKEAEKNHRQLGVRIHPDKQTSFFASLKSRCGPAMAALNNALDAVKLGFTKHRVPGITGLEAYFSLDDDSPAIVVRWEGSERLETEITIFADDDEEDILDIWQVPCDVGIHVFPYEEHGQLFKMEAITFTVAHIGLFGAQAENRGPESRLTLPLTDEVYECIDGVETRRRTEWLEDRLRKLLSAQQRVWCNQHGSSGGRRGRKRKRNAWNSSDYGRKKQRYRQHNGSQWSRSSGWSWSGSSSWHTSWEGPSHGHTWTKW